MKTIDTVEALGAEREYVSDSTLAALEGLPAEAWPAIVAGARHFGPADAVPGVDCTVAKTHETIQDWDDSRERHWSERGEREELILAGHRAVAYETLQLKRGLRRHSCVVIDCGPSRAVLAFP